jgi:hypothetical protein
MRSATSERRPTGDQREAALNHPRRQILARLGRPGTSHCQIGSSGARGPRPARDARRAAPDPDRRTIPPRAGSFASFDHPDEVATGVLVIFPR